MKSDKKDFGTAPWLGTALWLGLLLLIVLFLIVPSSRELFMRTTGNHPYIMGFLKFAILSTMGEFLALRLSSGRWQMVKGVLPKMVVWGLLGVAIVFMFALYTGGVDSAAAAGLLYTGYPKIKILRALYISTFMNLTFGPIFMAAHRVTDGVIESRVEGQKSSVVEIVKGIDWPGFITFVVAKTIPLFWIPAHTITFLLPEEYKVLFAASLSIVLGLILSMAKERN